MPWKVSGTSCDPCYITESEWDAEAMMILMNINHGRNRSVPEIINLEMLARLAVFIDYYDCHEVVEFWVTKSWVEELGAIPLETQFEIVMAVALKESDEPIQNLGLPIPPRIFVETGTHRTDDLWAS
ncbi:hypothetical protein G7054_g4441 [Neopestalotiopsis clavispora]|nr:hypothetical protein G7054_g4441 [Neopestalotiopsis clavispora]